MPFDLLRHQYRVQDKLSDALYGAVWLCEDVRSSSSDSSNTVAIKQVSMQQAQRALSINRHMDNPWDERRVMTRLMRLGDHSNILRFHQEFVENGSWFVVMDYCNGGDVLDLLHQFPGHRLPESVAMGLFAQIANGVSFMHSNGIAHRDLSLENVLLHDNVPKLCDFGLSTECDRMCKERVGKAYYMAPEVVTLDDEYDPAAADMWSLGIMLFIMLTGSPLSPSASVEEKGFQALATFGVCKILQVWEMDSGVSTSVMDLLEGLLQVNPAKRHTIDDVLAHPAFQSTP
ncbi:Serine/threonine protein kinase, partial [Globisporangium splendens]